ncbi:MAG TPA: hypothetical protein VK306_09595 [Acidimicrobiales bacterium]|nr:hypothetical protein [Acidimicrobiales bacterium]
MVSHALAAATAAAVMMVAMSGCADDADDVPRPSGARVGDLDAAGPATFERAVEATRAAPSARVELQTLYTGLDQLDDAPPGVDDVRMVQRASFDRRSHQAQAEVDMSELAAAVGATDDDVPGDFRAPARMLIDGDTFYAQLGPMAEAYGLDPSTWIERDLGAFAGQAVDNETMALLLEPLGMLELLRLPLDDVRVVGVDRVRGAPATHLAATVDLDPASASSTSDPDPASASSTSDSDPASASSMAGDFGGRDASGPAGAAGRARADAEAAGQIGERFRSLGLDELPVDVWVGDDQIVRRLEFSIDGAATGRRSAGAMTTTFDVYDVGEPIELTVPAGADVIDPDELATRIGGG